MFMDPRVVTGLIGPWCNAKNCPHADLRSGVELTWRWATLRLTLEWSILRLTERWQPTGIRTATLRVPGIREAKSRVRQIRVVTWEGRARWRGPGVQALEVSRLTVEDGGLTYQLCSRRLDTSFVWNCIRDDPDCFAKSADVVINGFEILDRISNLDGLWRKRWFLAVPDRENYLNPKFMRVLATIPLMMQAKGFEDLTAYVSLSIIGIDVHSMFFNWLWQMFKKCLFYLFRVFMIKCKFQPRTRQNVCTFFSTISKEMMYSDEVRMNFIRLRKDDMVYTMSPFNGAEFRYCETPDFDHAGKAPVPYKESTFGRYKAFNGDYFEAGEIPEGTPVITHWVNNSRIDSMFLEDGSFLNFINNEHLHLGKWEGNDKENFQDLLRVMESMNMLPLVQTDKLRF